MAQFTQINDQLCMSVDAVAAAMGIAFEQALNTIWKGLKCNRQGRLSWQHYKDKEDGRKCWIVYAALPELTKQRVDHYYGDVQKAYYCELMESQAKILVNTNDKAHYIKSGLSDSKCEQLTVACGWMRLVVSDWWKTYWKKRTVFQEDAADIIAQQNLYGLKVSSAGSLRRKIKAWKERGRDSLIPRYFNNENARKVSEAVINRLIDLYASPLKPSLQDVHKVYNREAAGYGWPELSDERIRQLLAKHKFLTMPARHGIEASRNMLEASLKRRRASFADALWTMDGTTVQLYYTEDGKTRSSNLYIYSIVDANSTAMIGYAIQEGRGEAATIVQAALRDAVRKTGNRPYQLQYDNSSANKSTECEQLFTKLARVGFPCAPYNGKAKRIERIFGHIEQHHMRLLPNFKGGNITTRSMDSKANPDHILKLEKSGQLPTKQELINELKLLFTIYNKSPWKKGAKQSREERYQVAHARRQQIDYLLQVDLFWVQRRQSVRYTKDGLIMQVDGEKYYYVVEEKRGIESRSFREQHLGDSFQVKYDPDDLEYINLYQDNEWVNTARLKYEFAEAVADLQEGECAVIKEALHERKEDIRRNRRKLEKIKEYERNASRPVLSHELVHKEVYNKIEQDTLDEMLEGAGRIIEQPTKKRRKRYSMYNIDNADGSRIID